MFTTVITNNNVDVTVVTEARQGGLGVFFFGLKREQKNKNK
jgi:hypothetical protein